MKKYVALPLVILLVLVGNVAFAGSSSSVIQLRANPNLIDTKTGYRWHCETCDYLSYWHLFAQTSVRSAQAHAVKHPGHISSIYSVKNLDLVEHQD
ncbi:hypothetical protein [Lactococcus kimchii]|uniref:hypothetical protein n=1 Tax=Lactococcus sp. S-13 TaxID=2507158 RepID=UPI0010238EB6|nr:hypothetical protein [Lactococcus sp. S-13]RZI49560.1 hypothetical protein EQJ87_09075 [Lactococcus sp. S-13]